MADHRAASDLLHSGLERIAASTPDDVGIRADDDTYTWSDLDGGSNAFARHLIARGIGPGDRIAVMLTNRVEFTMVVQGVSRAGAASVLLSPAWRAAEVGHAMSLTSPAGGVADGESVAVLADALGADAVLDLDDAADLESALGGDRSPIGPDIAGPGDESVLVFSSGTTGMPKAVRHTHASMVVAIEHWIESLGLTAADSFQVATPPSHILGLLNLVTAAAAGAPVRLHERFDVEELLRFVEIDQTTLEMAVAPIALAIANLPDLEERDLSSLRYILWGATPVTPSVAEEVTRRTGVRWIPGYGASELPVLACNPVDRPDEWRLDSAGLPPTGVELRIVDLDTGEVLPAGETGEVQARSPSVMAGYLPDDANDDAFTADGWYRTGDVGWLEPEGWVHLTDRSKEMIKVSGFQVAPAEIETVLHGHPGVLDCAVFGIPDRVKGEVPAAAVTVDPANPVTPDELKTVVADTLATYKRLAHVVVVDDVPRLPSGKVLRRTLRDEWATKLGAN